jgi:hypothetical protein
MAVGGADTVSNQICKAFYRPVVRTGSGGNIDTPRQVEARIRNMRRQKATGSVRLSKSPPALLLAALSPRTSAEAQFCADALLTQHSDEQPVASMAVRVRL